MSVAGKVIQGVGGLAVALIAAASLVWALAALLSVACLIILALLLAAAFLPRQWREQIEAWRVQIAQILALGLNAMAAFRAQMAQNAKSGQDSGDSQQGASAGDPPGPSEPPRA